MSGLHHQLPPPPSLLHQVTAGFPDRSGALVASLCDRLVQLSMQSLLSLSSCMHTQRVLKELLQEKLPKLTQHLQMCE